MNMTYLPDSRVTTLAIHYSATPVESDFSSEDIDRMHRQRGFKEIGYHYYIRKNGDLETGRDLSEPGRFEVGAHSKGNNSSSIGICFEGGVRRSAPNVGFDSRTHAQKVTMEALILSLQERFPGAVVKGHRDMPGAATQCPGFNATEWWDEVSARRVAEQNVAADASENRTTRLKSKTLQAQFFQWMGTGGLGVLTWWNSTDEQTRWIVAGLAGVSVIAGAVVFRERLQKWAAGIR
jgi:N-acetylmuramoyl-L-alanine amidase